MKIYKIKVNGKSYRVELEAVEETKTAPLPPASEPAKAEAKPIEAVKPAAAPASSGGQEVVSPIQGTVVKLLVKIGDKVQKGTPVVIVEAMKLENEVVSPYEGEVAEIFVAKGQSVTAKERILAIR